MEFGCAGKFRIDAKRCETDAKFFSHRCEIKCLFRYVSLRCETGKVVAKLVAKQENSLRNLLKNSNMRSETGCKIEQYDAKLVAKQQKRCKIGYKTAKTMRNWLQSSKNDAKRYAKQQKTGAWSGDRGQGQVAGARTSVGDPNDFFRIRIRILVYRPIRIRILSAPDPNPNAFGFEFGSE